jgi:hypothetical protein
VAELVMVLAVPWIKKMAVTKQTDIYKLYKAGLQITPLFLNKV